MHISKPALMCTALQYSTNTLAAAPELLLNYRVRRRTRPHRSFVMVGPMFTGRNLSQAQLMDLYD
ncbi:hypothetical protein MtrunA17_Chr2g0313501 [Medicago truncatula]|nr:hypothetical protein MtrunA17_Chr2g0313501 [Medicago truncatula]